MNQFGVTVFKMHFPNRIRNFRTDCTMIAINQRKTKKTLNKKRNSLRFIFSEETTTNFDLGVSLNGDVSNYPSRNP